MKKSIYIGIGLLAVLLLFSGILVSRSDVNKAEVKIATVSNGNDACCMDKASSKSASYTSTNSKSGECPYSSGCSSQKQSTAAQASLYNSHCSEGDAAKCPYKSNQTKMAQKDTDAGQSKMALTSTD